MSPAASAWQQTTTDHAHGTANTAVSQGAADGAANRRGGRRTRVRPARVAPALAFFEPGAGVTTRARARGGELRHMVGHRRGDWLSPCLGAGRDGRGADLGFASADRVAATPEPQRPSTAREAR